MAERVFAAFCTAGLWPGMGPVLAAGLDEAGIRCPDDVTVARLGAVPKVGLSRAGRLFSAFLAARPTYDVVELLVPAGIAARSAARLIDLLGSGAGRLLRDDPWRLLQLPGIEVAEADTLAARLLDSPWETDSRRARALVGYLLSQAARDGHTRQATGHIAQELRWHRVADPERAVTEACAGELVEEIAHPDGPMLALVGYALAERSIADSVRRLIRTATPVIVPRPKIAKGARPADSAAVPAAAAGKSVAAAAAGESVLDAVQRRAVDTALREGVSVLTGGPGTGKSRTVSEVVRRAEQAGKSIALAAPTGRAAKRLAELCDVEASTIHRLLGVQPRAGGSDGTVDFAAGFARGQAWPLDADVVVVDEASMLDVELAAALLSACADGTHLMIVGDAAQLPSIGPGQVLADLIDSGAVVTTELSTLYRQDAGGSIARLATAVRGGELPTETGAGREVVIVPARGSADCAHRVTQLVTDSIPRALGITVDQIQVVTPVHRGPAGTIELNAALKRQLNPAANPSGPRGSRVGMRFDVGDRVVATANHLEANPVGFANGEVGTVVKVVDRTVSIDFGSGTADVSGKILADISHGWAITVHRAQGSEFRAVVVVLPPEAGRMLSRPLVYTALTRAREHLSVVHGSGPALARAVRDVGGKPRQTLLGQWLVAE